MRGISSKLNIQSTVLRAIYTINYSSFFWIRLAALFHVLYSFDFNANFSLELYKYLLFTRFRIMKGNACCIL